MKVLRYWDVDCSLTDRYSLLSAALLSGERDAATIKGCGRGFHHGSFKSMNARALTDFGIG